MAKHQAVLKEQTSLETVQWGDVYKTWMSNTHNSGAQVNS